LPGLQLIPVKHMKIQRYLIVWLLLSVATSACSRPVDEMWQLAAELKSRGKQGIPGLLRALSSVSEQDRWAVVEYGRIGVCTKTLHELAKSGVYMEGKYPFYFRRLKYRYICPIPLLLRILCESSRV